MYATWGASLIVAIAMAASAAGFVGDSAVSRVQAHLAGVEAELLAADVSALTAAQRQARAAHVAVLREYREAGVFPHNHVVDYASPVFVDEHGTHCAVGYLLARDGRHDLVERIRSSRNLATVPELADEPELVAWLEQAGLSLAEAARIQPWYDPGPPPPHPQPVRDSPAYTTASLVGAGLGGGMVAWNLLTTRDDGRTLPGVLGLGVGIAEIGLAAYGSALDRRDERDIDRGYIAVNLGIGVVSSLLGVRTLLRSEPASAVIGGDVTGRQTVAPAVQWQLSPWLAARDGGAGMQLNVRF